MSGSGERDQIKRARVSALARLSLKHHHLNFFNNFNSKCPVSVILGEYTAPAVVVVGGGIAEGRERRGGREREGCDAGERKLEGRTQL